jgi:integrase/recombinase XerD
MKLIDAVDDYLHWLVLEKGRQPATIAAYRRDLTDVVAWMETRNYGVVDLDSSVVTAYLDSLRSSPLAASSVNRHWSALRGWCRYLTLEGDIPANPTAGIATVRRAKSLPMPLDEIDVIRLLESVAGTTAMDLRDRALLELLYGTGVRVSEAVGIELQHLDFDESLIVVTGKGDKQRLVPMGRTLTQVLRTYLANAGRPRLVTGRSKAYLFLNHYGGPLTRQGVAVIIRRRALAIGIPNGAISAHVFRHSCATHMLEHGADIRVVQELLGHASIATTQVYTAVSLSSLQSAYAEAHPRAHN